MNLLKEKANEIKALIIKNAEKSNKKKIENLVIFLVLLVITVIAINTIWKTDDNKNTDSSNNSLGTSNINSIGETITTDDAKTETDLEKNLETVLSKISGVGKVSVLITYSETSEVVSTYNESTQSSTTQETDTSGGKRTIEQNNSDKQLAYQEDSRWYKNTNYAKSGAA